MCRYALLHVHAHARVLNLNEDDEYEKSCESGVYLLTCYISTHNIAGLNNLYVCVCNSVYINMYVHILICMCIY